MVPRKAWNEGEELPWEKLPPFWPDLTTSTRTKHARALTLYQGTVYYLIQASPDLQPASVVSPSYKGGD